MEAVASSKMDEFTRLGDLILVHFNEREVEDEDGNTSYKYSTAKFSISCTRDERIEAIIKSKYPTYGSELAAIRKGEAEHQELVDLAKEIADRSLEVVW